MKTGECRSKQVQGVGVQWQCLQVQVTHGIFVQNPWTVLCIYSIIPLKYNTFYHILAVYRWTCWQPYSNEKFRLSIFPFQAILSCLLQHPTDFHSARQTLPKAVHHCTEWTPSITSMALWFLYSSIQLCTDRPGFADAVDFFSVMEYLKLFIAWINIPKVSSSLIISDRWF